MSKPDKKAKHYYIVTFGCQMNEADSERIAGFLEDKGYQSVDDKYKADLVIINTCSVRESAENRAFGLVKNLKVQTLNLKPQVILTGCMVGSALGKRKRYTLKQLRKKLPGVEIIPLEKLLKDFRGDQKHKKKKSALVPIMRGCDNFCTYCVVPYARGKEASRPFKEIICEVKNLVKRGYGEIMLLGQNVNSYAKNQKSQPKAGRPLAEKIKNFNKYKTPFALLLATLNDIKGLKKIKFMTSNPWDLTDDIIETMKLPKIDRYLHLPVQSGDDEILRKMNRKYTVGSYSALVKKIRQEIPNIEIGTDIIVGFPGETEKQFENTVKLCKKTGFKIAYISKYSPRRGTAAFKLKDNVVHEEKKRRWKVLDKLINKDKYRIKK